MPTYLIAILISDYKCMDGIANTPGFKAVDVSVCARPNAYDQLDLAFNSSIEILEFFENYYKVGYPLPKLGYYKKLNL
jgi:aminopeptidase N